MADHSKIEWTDATLAVESARACWRQNRDIAERDSLIELRHRFTSSSLKPRPHVTVPLATVAGRAGRHRIGGFGLPSPGDRDYVVKGRRRRTTIGAASLKLLEKHCLGGFRHRRNATLPSIRALFTPHPIRRVGVVAANLLRAETGSTGSLRHLCRRQPHFASPAPSQPVSRLCLTLRFGRPRRLPRGSAISADIAAPVEAAAVNLEVGQLTVLTAFAAPLLRAAAHDVAPVRPSPILGGTHGV